METLSASILQTQRKSFVARLGRRLVLSFNHTMQICTKYQTNETRLRAGHIPLSTQNVILRSYLLLRLTSRGVNFSRFISHLFGSRCSAVAWRASECLHFTPSDRPSYENTKDSRNHGKESDIKAIPLPPRLKFSLKLLSW